MHPLILKKVLWTTNKKFEMEGVSGNPRNPLKPPLALHIAIQICCVKESELCQNVCMRMSIYSYMLNKNTLGEKKYGVNKKQPYT